MVRMTEACREGEWLELEGDSTRQTPGLCKDEIFCEE